MSKHLIALLSGLIFPLGFSPFNYLFLTVVSLIMLLYLLDRSGTRKESALIGFFYGFGLWSIGISWVIVSIYFHGGVSLIGSILITLIFIITLSVYKLFMGIIFFNNKSNTTFNALILFPFSWAIIEIARGFLFTGFPWLSLGTSITNSFLHGWIPIIGASGGSIILCFISGCFFLLIKEKLLRNKIIYLNFLALILLLPPLFLNDIYWTKNIGVQSVSTYQPNLTLEDKWSMQGIEKTRSLIKQAIQNAEKKELILFPETALITNNYSREAFLGTINSSLLKKEISLITGILGEKANKRTNTVKGYGVAKGEYDKTKLVPFGEYVPFYEIIGDFLNFIGINIVNMHEGSYFSHISVGKAKVAPSICYEIAFDSIMLQSSINSNLLISLSNDTWFGKTIGPYQHLELAQTRALESEKALIRSTNSGISAIINEKGLILNQTSIFEGESLKNTLNLREGKTPYFYLGKIHIYLYLFITGLYLLLINRTYVIKDVK